MVDQTALAAAEMRMQAIPQTAVRLFTTRERGAAFKVAVFQSLTAGGFSDRLFAVSVLHSSHNYNLHGWFL